MPERGLLDRVGPNPPSHCRYKSYIRRACFDIVKSSGVEIAHILVEKNAEVDTDIMNCSI